jgi:Cu-Zn family superoxide dismutase
MNIIIRVLVLIFFILSTPVHAASPGADAKAIMVDKDGKEIGVAQVTQAPTGVLIHVRVGGLQPGKHGLHLHSVGVCEPVEGFTTAKGHVGKMEGAHGLMNPQGPEPGDLPNLFVGADGVGETELFTTLVSVSGGDHPLLDADGSTFIIHEAADNHLTQPIGGAGGRVACGVIESAN